MPKFRRTVFEIIAEDGEDNALQPGDDDNKLDDDQEAQNNAKLNGFAPDSLEEVPVSDEDMAVCKVLRKCWHFTDRDYR